MNAIILVWTVLAIVGKPCVGHHVKYTYEFTYEVKICQEWNVSLVGIVSLSPSCRVQNLTMCAQYVHIACHQILRLIGKGHVTTLYTHIYQIYLLHGFIVSWYQWWSMTTFAWYGSGGRDGCKYEVQLWRRLEPIKHRERLFECLHLNGGTYEGLDLVQL